MYEGVRNLAPLMCALIRLDLGNSFDRKEGERMRAHTQVARLPKKKMLAHT